MKRKSKKQNNVVNGFLAKIYSCIRCAEKKEDEQRRGGDWMERRRIKSNLIKVSSF